MLKRSERTMRRYKRAGALMRLFKEAGEEALINISEVLSAGDQDKLTRALKQIDVVCLRAEDNMFRDYPRLSDKYLDVFYGNLEDSPRNEVDKEIIGMAREAADGLLTGRKI